MLDYIKEVLGTYMEKKDDNQAQAAKELYRMLEKLLMAAKTANVINPVKIHQGLIRDVEDTLKEFGQYAGDEA